MNAPKPPERKLVLKMSISLDGFVAGPAGEIDWIFHSARDDSRASVLETLQGAGVHIMGSGSYYDMAAYWPFADVPMAAPMNAAPKVIFSRTGLKDGTHAAPPAGKVPDAALLQSWAAPEVASGDLAEEVARLKSSPGNYILAHGGVRFGRSLVASGLVDEYRLNIHPILLGQGQSLFTSAHPMRDLSLVSATAFSGGAIGVVYRRHDPSVNDRTGDVWPDSADKWRRGCLKRSMRGMKGVGDWPDRTRAGAHPAPVDNGKLDIRLKNMQLYIAKFAAPGVYSSVLATWSRYEQQSLTLRG
jgi:dihydrofolate reductase